MPDFLPNDIGFARWQVLELPTDEGVHYLRVTHIFKNDVFVMRIKEPIDVRYATRPTRYGLREFIKLSGRADTRWGRIAMPAQLIAKPEENSWRSDQAEAAWDLIEPLVEALENRENLSSANFSVLIRVRAQAKDASFNGVKRLLLRYYYFGATKMALVPFLPGAKPKQKAYLSQGARGPDEQKMPKRRGRASIRSQIYGENKFVVSEADIADMVSSLRRQLRVSKTGYKQAWKSYLSHEFARRNRSLFAQYTNFEIDEPVSLRQYTYYLKRYAELDATLANNLIIRTTESGHHGSLTASGPGDIYEIDGTGGRLHLVTESDPPILVDRPNIYLLIDRWSRFVVSVYISLRAPSYEELRYALLIGFTSRAMRFRAMGCNVDDERWPVGRIPIRIVADRGSEFLSNAIEQSLSTDLRIRLTNLPPLTPDAKSIVERYIRTLKAKMVAKGMSGVYVDRPMNPVTKRAKEKASGAVLTSLGEAYRDRIQIVIEYNNEPHSTLKGYRELTQAGVDPTPHMAYLWGLKNKASKGAFPYSEDELAQIFLSPDTATIAHGKLKYGVHTYYPTNEYAHVLARESTARAKRIAIRVDRTYPRFVYVSSKRGERAEFEISASGADTLGIMTLDEEMALEHEKKLRWSIATHKSNISQVNDLHDRGKRAPSRQNTAQIAEKRSRDATHAARVKDTESQKALLMGKEERSPVSSGTSNEEPEWIKRRKQLEADHIDLVAKMLSKK